jgi:uncharacterized membrane protein HdeD (DUF308 family)
MLVIREFAKRWWIIVLEGVAAVVFGLLLLAQPGAGLPTLVLIVALWAFADGILAFFASLGAAEEGEPWWLWLLFSLAGITVGVIALRWPVVTGLVLYLLIACWLMVRGLVEIAASIALRRELEGEVWMFLGGIASIAFGAWLVIAPPAEGALAVGYAMGIYALIVGFTFIMAGVRLRSLSASVSGTPRAAAR